MTLPESGHKGWVALYRKLADDPLWLGERFTKGQAWIDLLLLANHSDSEIIVGLKTIQVKRGQIFSSKVKLAIRWKWDRKTVTAFLQMLKSRQMVDTKTDRNIQHGFTVISIQNYDKYQFDRQQKLQQEVQQSHSETDTNNNDNNENNEITVNGVKNYEKKGSSPITKLPDLNISIDEQDYIGKEILNKLKDERSKRFYKLVASKIPANIIFEKLSVAVKDGAKKPASLFTYQIEKVAVSMLKGEMA